MSDEQSSNQNESKTQDEYVSPRCAAWALAVLFILIVNTFGFVTGAREKSTAGLIFSLFVITFLAGLLIWFIRAFVHAFLDDLRSISK